MAGLKGFFDWYHDNGIIPNIWKGATGQLSQEKINDENIEFQRERNAIEDARYENETKYNRAFAEDERNYNRAFTAEEQAYNRAFAEDERNYNRAFAAEEQAYNRAFAAEEQAYNRAFAEDERNYQRDWAFNERNYQRDWALNERDYQRSLQQKIFEREDTAIARQAAALRAQGINPLSQTMSGLGAGSVVSSSAPGTSSPGSSSSPGSISPGSTSPGSSHYSGSSYSLSSVPGLSGRQGKALQKAMITSQGINGLLAPILQTLNTVDSLKGNGIQRDVLNAQAVKTQAEANMAVMNMFDTANRLNLKENSFLYGVNKNKIYRFNVDDKTYRPYYYSPQTLNIQEGNIKDKQYEIFSSDSKLKKLQADKMDSVGDSMKYLTGKLQDKGSDMLLDTFAGVVEQLLLRAFKLK